MEKLKIVFMPSPGIGHIIPMVELAKKLDRQRFSITVLITVPAFSAAITAYMDSVLSSGCDILFHELPYSDPPHKENQKVETFITRLIEAYKPQVKDALCSLSEPVGALIVDLFCTSTIDVAEELGIPAYLFFTPNAAVLSAMLYLPTLHETAGEDFHIPGLPPVPPHYMPSVMKNKMDEAYSVLVDHARKFSKAKGLILNSFTELEARQIHAIVNGNCLPDQRTPRLFPVGPLIANEPATQRHSCIEWLNNQPVASVVALCFGSMSSFETAQVREMAAGLERSGQRFLWALQSPTTEGYQQPTNANPEEVLPEGFVDRTKGRGLVWPSWVPQVEILAHRAVGGFVTHCGWNSVLESLWFGVPMLGWPLYAEQHLNCLMMSTELGVALELEFDDKQGGFVRADEVEKGVRCLMGNSEEIGKVRTKVKEMKAIGRRATMKGGSSYEALKDLMEEFVRV